MKKTPKQVKKAVPKTSKQKPSGSGNASTFSLYFICGLFAFILYSNTLNHEYAYDDYPTIYGNQLTMQGVHGIPTLLRTAYWYGIDQENDWLYRPLSMVMFAVEWSLAPNQPALGHWMNVLWYVLSSLLLLRFLSDLLNQKNRLLAFAITLVWIAHPVHTEVIANIKSRDEIMCFLFSILYNKNLSLLF